MMGSVEIIGNVQQLKDKTQRNKQTKLLNRYTRQGRAGGGGD